MTMPHGKDLMLKRHEIVMRIMDINSRRLHLDNEMHGLDIERRIAERDLAAEPQLKQQLEQINGRLAALGEECSKISAEREWLEQSLTEFDRGVPASTPKNGNA